MGGAIYEESRVPFWKYLKFGEFTRVGHGVTFGLGKYALRAN